MPSLGEIVENRKHLPEIAAVLRSLEDQPKLMRDLERLYFAKAGIQVQRDDGRRARGETIWSCSRVGAAFSRHFTPTGYVDHMMWVGYLAHIRDEERWIMRPLLRDAIESLGWFGREKIR